MDSKIGILTELEHVLCNNDKTNTGVLDFFKQFKISKLLSPFDLKKDKGFKVSTLIVAMCLFRIKGLSIWAMQKTGNNRLFNADENTFYRLMNNSQVEWRKILNSFAKQFSSITKKKGEALYTPSCLILDDTDLEKTGTTFEFIGRIFNHVTGRYIIGFKLLALGFWDGKSLIVADFSLHREKGKRGNYGVSKKEKVNQFNKKREANCPSKERVKELDMKKTEVAISMIKRAVKNGFKASYVLMDSWFTNDYIIKSVRSIKQGMLHILGMCKIDKRKYKINGKELNAKQIIVNYERTHGKYSRKHKSRYIPVVVDYKGVKVKLFLLRYRNSKNWTLLLTTNLTLTFVEALELYQSRWTIEVLFKECKQYLRLGASQNTDFDGQIADATLVFITHTILTLQKRFEVYETMGELYRESQQKLLELSLWQRILKVFIKMLQHLMELFNIDIEETLEKLINDERANKQILAVLQLMIKNQENEEILDKMAA
jgi:hypothetical protein